MVRRAHLGCDSGARVGQNQKDVSAESTMVELLHGRGRLGGDLYVFEIYYYVMEEFELKIFKFL